MRFLRYGLMIAVILMIALPIMAQEQTPPAPIPNELILSEAQDALAEAQKANELAFNLLGLFEATSGAVGIILGIIVPVIGVVAAYLGFSRLASAQNKLDEAKTKFQEEINKSRDDFEDEMKKTVKKYFDDFGIQIEELRKKQDEALKTSIVEQRQDGVRANLALSLLPSAERQYRAQDYKGAIETYQRALGLDSTNSIIHYRLGYVFTQQGNLIEAKKHIEEALKLDPQSPYATVALAYVYRRIGDKLNKPEDSLERDRMYNESERYFLDVLPKYEKLLDEDGESWWGAFGGLYKRRGQFQLAIEKYQLATEATKSSSYPYSNLAQLYMITGEKDNMTRMYERVERLAQAEVYAEIENYWAYADLITSRVAQGKFDEAWKVVDEALPTAPIDATYPLELLLSTLKDVQKFLPEYAEQINRFIDHIQKFLDKRKAS